MSRKTTISIIKCDVGSLAGHHIVPKPLLNIAEKNLKKAKEQNMINSYYVFNAGDDLQLMVHEKGESNAEIHKLAWTTFQEAANKALDLRLYGVGQDLLKNAFSGKPMIADLFDDPAFELARKEAVKIGSMLRRMGEFEPARLGPAEMEYTTLGQVLARLKERFEPALELPTRSRGAVCLFSYLS